MRGKRSLFWKIPLSILMVILVVFSIMVLVFNITHIETRVRGQSMAPTLNRKVEGDALGDTIFISKTKKYTYGDIIVLKNENTNEYIIKRFIAKEGDTVKISANDETREYSLIVNGNVVMTRSYYEGMSSFVNYQNYCAEHSADDTRIVDGNVIIVKQGEIFIMGDNWENSLDSTFYGPLLVENVVGKVDIIVEYGHNIVWGAIKGTLKNIFS